MPSSIRSRAAMPFRLCTMKTPATIRTTSVAASTPFRSRLTQTPKRPMAWTLPREMIEHHRGCHRDIQRVRSKLHRNRHTPIAQGDVLLAQSLSLVPEEDRHLSCALNLSQWL